MKERVVVFKDKKSREIKTYVNLEGHGAMMSVEDFMSLLAEKYGSPATTITKKGFATKLQASADEVIREMKSKTREVAAINMEPEIKVP